MPEMIPATRFARIVPANVKMKGVVMLAMTVP